MMCFPSAVYDLASHQFLLIILLHYFIDLFCTVELVDNFLVLRDVSIDKVQASCNNLQLIHYLLQFERH